jgi:hypothetical protein
MNLTELQRVIREVASTLDALSIDPANIKVVLHEGRDGHESFPEARGMMVSTDDGTAVFAMTYDYEK